jgi:hypothetical protein
VSKRREQHLPPPPIEEMRYRSEATKTKRCAGGKRLAMRCRFAAVVLDLKESDYHRLDQAAKEMGLTKSAYLRMILFQRLKEEGR